MPYYVYRISADRQKLTPIQVFDHFQPAKAHCRSLRLDKAADDHSTVRMVFAKDEKTAEGLLRAKHKPSGPLEEWEA